MECLQSIKTFKSHANTFNFPSLKKGGQRCVFGGPVVCGGGHPGRGSGNQGTQSSANP